MGAKAGFRLELPPRLKSKAQLRQEVYRGKNRLLKDDPVWVAAHPGFQIARKVQPGEEFCLEIWGIQARQNITFFVEVDKALFVMLQVIQGALHLELCPGGGGHLTRKQSLIGPMPPGRYLVKVPVGTHLFFCSYIRSDRFKTLSRVYSSLGRLQAATPGETGLFTSREFRRKVVRLLYRIREDKYSDGLEGLSLDAGLWELLRCALETPGKNERFGEAGGRKVVYQVKTYLDDLAANRRRLPGVAELADQFSLHPHHLARVFRAKFGMTPRRYLLHLKMQAGFSMLKQEKLPVHIVAHALGYEDSYSFGRQFRAHFGFSPGRLLRPDEGTDPEM